MNSPDDAQTQFDMPRGMIPSPHPRASQFTPENTATSIREQAELFASRQQKNAAEMIERYNDEINRLETVLEDYRDAVKILESLRYQTPQIEASE